MSIGDSHVEQRVWSPYFGPQKGDPGMSILGEIVTALIDAVSGRKMTRAELDAALDKLAAANPEKLDWRNSIVDLMKLVGMDSSHLARQRLAAELGYQGSYNGTSEMNIFLHAEVMRSLAEHNSISR